jgi:hypothetical protein
VAFYYVKEGIFYQIGNLSNPPIYPGGNLKKRIGMRTTRNMKWLKARTFFIGGMISIPFGILLNAVLDIFKGTVVNLHNLVIYGITFFVLSFLMILYTNKKSFEIDDTV